MRFPTRQQSTERRRRAGLLVIGALAGVVLGGGLGVFADTNPSAITVCANKKTGALRYAKTGNCTKSETRFSLNETGPAGPPGTQGASGAAGEQGATGKQGTTGEQGATGPQGPAGAQGTPGPQGDVGPAGPQGSTGAQGATGATGPAGDSCVALLRWATCNVPVGDAAVGSSALGVAFDGKHLWVAKNADNTIVKVDPASMAVTGTVVVPVGPREVMFDGFALWVTSSPYITKIDPTTAVTLASQASLGPNPMGMASSGDAVWVADRDDGSVSKINQNNATEILTVTVGASPVDVAYDGTDIWVANWGSDSISKIDPNTNTVTATVPVGFGPVDIAFDGRSLWVVNQLGSSVTKINPRTNQVEATVSVGSLPQAIAFDGTSLWVTDAQDKTMSKIDPIINIVTATTQMYDPVTYLAFDGSNMWVVLGGMALRKVPT